jgi:hypothetical protein
MKANPGAGRHEGMFTRGDGIRANFCYAGGMRISRALAILPLLIAPAAAGCGVIGFDISQDIPSNMIIGTQVEMAAVVDAPPTPLEINIDAEAEKQGGLASSAWLKELTFTVTSPTKGTFYFVSAVAITIDAPSASLPEIKIAELQPVPNLQTISITPVPGVELLPYARAGAQIHAKAIGYFPKEDTTYVGKVVIHVKI